MGDAPSERSIAVKTSLRRARDFLRSEEGPTATEYAVMLALIIVLCMGVITSIGTNVSGIFAELDQDLQ